MIFIVIVNGPLVESLEGEEWKDAVGFHGWYQVSNFGRVKSLPRDSGFYFYDGERLLTGFIKNNGYHVVDFSVNGKKLKKYVHRLVAEAFIDNDDPEHKTEVNHKDENKQNNHVNNLEWCTSSYNKRHNHLNEKKGLKMRNRPSMSTPVIQMDMMGNIVNTFPSSMEAQRQTGCLSTSIIRTCRGKTFTCGGYIWRYQIQ